MRENVLAKRAVIVGVRGLGQGLRVRVGDEGFLSRNDQVFPERPGSRSAQWACSHSTLRLNRSRSAPGEPLGVGLNFDHDEILVYLRDVLAPGAIVVRVRGCGHGPSISVCVRNEGFLSSDSHVPPTRLGQEVIPVGIQPVEISLQSLVVGPCPCDPVPFRHFFHDDRRVDRASAPSVFVSPSILVGSTGPLKPRARAPSLRSSQDPLDRMMFLDSGQAHI
jgi:hypothetical protein